MLAIHDDQRVRTLTLDRPDALNAFSNDLFHADGLRVAADDPSVAVVVITGAGRAFSAGADLAEMAAGNAGERGQDDRGHGFPVLLDVLAEFSKPLICAVNGLGLGIGMTILGYADLSFMSTKARLKCPFTSLGVAPEAASSFLFPKMIGRQNAAWVLLSAEWFSAAECQEMGLVWKVCEPDDLMPTTSEYARRLAAQPISSLIETKQAMNAPDREAIREARAREDAAFSRLLGGPANTEALAAFLEKREPDFTGLT